MVYALQHVYCSTPRTHHCLHDKQGMEDVIFKEKTIAAKALWPSTWIMNLQYGTHPR